jgi:hypothetical protein
MRSGVLGVFSISGDRLWIQSGRSGGVRIVLSIPFWLA